MTAFLFADATPWSVARRARQLRFCVVEARPVVQLIYALRFLTAYALTCPGPGAADLGRLAAGLVVWLLATGSVYLFDGVMDVVEDRVNGSARPIARGELPREVALAVSIAWAVLSLAGAVVLGSAYIVLVLGVLLLGYAYSGPLVRLKRWSPATGGTVMLGGLLTYVAGGPVSAGEPLSGTLFVFAAAMSGWMALVGALAKDFSDIAGDARAGRRTCAVVRGVRPAAGQLTRNALAVGGAFIIGALCVNRLLLWPAVAVAVGAVAVAVGCRAGLVTAPRRPYRAFMITQYLAHMTVLVTVA